MPVAPATLTPLEAEVLDLRDRVFELEEELRALREASTPKVEWPDAWRLSQGETKVLNALHAGRGRRFTREQLVQKIHGYETTVDRNLISVHICRIRGKLRKLGIELQISTRQGYGFALERAAVTFLDRVIAEQRADAEAVVPLAA